MFRLVKPRSPVVAAVALVILLPLCYGVWVVFRHDPPHVMLVMLAMTFALAAVVLFVALYGPVTWEVDDAGIRKTVFGRTTRQFPLSQVRYLQVTRHRLPAGAVDLSLWGDNPQALILMDLDDTRGLKAMRTFYEACAFHLLPYGAVSTNPFGWRPRTR